MASREVWHVVPSENGWKVKKENASRASKTFENKEPAVKRAREIAQNHEPSQVIIHNSNGVIVKEFTYGQDPERYDN